MADPIVDLIKNQIYVDPEHSRIKFGAADIAYHCDKFATRITKGLEDVLGIEKTSALLNQSAAESNFANFQAGLSVDDTFSNMSVPEKMDVILAIYNVLGHGAITLEKNDGTSTKAHSKHSYLAEGFIENMEHWQWKKREEPFCHEMCGDLRAAFASATGKDLSDITVKEIQCRTMGSDECVFEVEVK